MLSAREVQDRLRETEEERSRLWIVPTPDLDKLAKRGATSVDLRLGRWFRSFKQNQSTDHRLYRHPNDSHDEVLRSPLSTSEHFVAFGNPFVLHPGRFVLGVTLEWLKLPISLSGYVTGKSSLGRHGLVIETAAGIHPGFSGCLTLELANVGEVPLQISPGMQICQIFLHETRGGKTTNPGTFSGRRKPIVELPSEDPVFKRLCGNRRRE